MSDDLREKIAACVFRRRHSAGKYPNRTADEILALVREFPETGEFLAQENPPTQENDAEPVAWRVRATGEAWSYKEIDCSGLQGYEGPDDKRYESQPLYAAPPAAKVSKEKIALIGDVISSDTPSGGCSDITDATIAKALRAAGLEVE